MQDKLRCGTLVSISQSSDIKRHLENLKNVLALIWDQLKINDMRKVCILLLVCIIVSCKKEKAEPTPDLELRVQNQTGFTLTSVRTQFFFASSDFGNINDNQTTNYHAIQWKINGFSGGGLPTHILCSNDTKVFTTQLNPKFGRYVARLTYSASSDQIKAELIEE